MLDTRPARRAAPGVLGDITVLELSQGIPGAYCGKLLASLGARVIKVEPPEGDAGRSLPPFAGDTPHPERSAPFLYLNTAKESIALDLARAPGQSVFRRLVPEADVIVESYPPGTLARWGLSYAALSALNPGLVLASITPFGQDGPYRDYLTNEIVAEALGGLLFTIGTPGREPLKMGGNPALHNAGGAAFSAIMAALWQRDRTGQGQQIDLSIQEATAITQIHASIEATWQGTDAQQTASELVEARDGWVSTGLETGVAPETWPRVCDLLGRPDLVDDPRFASGAARRDHRDALKDVVREWVRGQDKEDVYHLLQGLRSIAGYVATAADVYRAGHLQARGFFQEIDHPVAGRARYPGLPFRIGDEPWTTGRAPLLGEHTAAIEAEIATSARPSASRARAVDERKRRGAGVRARWRAHPGPDAGGRRPVRDLSSVQPGRRGDQGRVPPAPGHRAGSGASRGRAPDEAVPAWGAGRAPVEPRRPLQPAQPRQARHHAGPHGVRGEGDLQAARRALGRGDRELPRLGDGAPGARLGRASRRQ